LLSSSLQTRSRKKSGINPSALLQDLHYALVRYHISSLVCAVFHVITFQLKASFVSSPECAYLSPGACRLLFMFRPIILNCLSPCHTLYCIPHAIIECPVTILVTVSYFDCFGLVARGFLMESLLESSAGTTPSSLVVARAISQNCKLSQGFNTPPFFGSEMAFCASMSAPLFAGSP